MIKFCCMCHLEREHGLNRSTHDGLATSCKECRKAYRDSNKEKIAEGKRASYLKKKEHYDAKSKAYYKSNKEVVAKRNKAYVELNRHKVNAKNSFRRKVVRDQTPRMAQDELDQINYLYWLARDLRAVSGEEYHVDHIMPLARGGLHHPDNLQILPADLNLSKGAKLPPLP